MAFFRVSSPFLGIIGPNSPFLGKIRPNIPIRAPRVILNIGLIAPIRPLNVGPILKNMKTRKIKESTKKKQFYHQSPLLSKENKAFLTK